MKFLTWESYVQNAKDHWSGHWSHFENRWRYHLPALEILKEIGVSDAKKVLEVGTMGAPLVVGSDLMDYKERWSLCGQTPTYMWDMRNLPWPIEDRKYEWFVALHVFQHLPPVQKECFQEARRVASRIIIAVPEEYKKGKGITISDFTEWNDGQAPPIVRRNVLGPTSVYCWLS